MPIKLTATVLHGSIPLEVFSAFRTRIDLLITLSKPAGHVRASRAFNKGTSPLPAQQIMGVYAVYIISKAGGLIYSLDNQKPPAEAQLLCKYPPSFVLEEGDRGVMVKFGEGR